MKKRPRRFSFLLSNTASFSACVTAHTRHSARRLTGVTRVTQRRNDALRSRGASPRSSPRRSPAQSPSTCPTEDRDSVTVQLFASSRGRDSFDTPRCHGGPIVPRRSPRLRPDAHGRTSLSSSGIVAEREVHPRQEQHMARQLRRVLRLGEGTHQRGGETGDDEARPPPVGSRLLHPALGGHSARRIASR